ncbi:hypothetical protein ACJRO7_034249 [Eucalyptus globulus]|uniref:Uncharacterized protein n=1 Tax=Eucalyptus globulus TaxID=34317 RepID=A0ABD3J5T6_EUCGL
MVLHETEGSLGRRFPISRGRVCIPPQATSKPFMNAVTSDLLDRRGFQYLSHIILRKMGFSSCETESAFAFSAALSAASIVMSLRERGKGSSRKRGGSYESMEEGGRGGEMGKDGGECGLPRYAQREMISCN